MNNEIPLEIQPLLGSYLQQLEEESPGLATAFHLVGSIALGGFNPRLSDDKCGRRNALLNI